MQPWRSRTGRHPLWATLVLALAAAGCFHSEPAAKLGKDQRSEQPSVVAQSRLTAQPLLDEAAGVVRAYWQARGLAFSIREAAPLRDHEDGAAASLSGGVIEDAHANGNPPSQNLTLSEIHVYVPRPERFPRVFLAAVTATDPDTSPEIYLVVFTKGARQAPWKASWWVKYANNTPLPSIVVDQDGFATQLAPSQQRRVLVTDAVTVERRLRDYLTQAEETDTPPRSGFFTDTADTYGTVKANEAFKKQSAQNGVAVGQSLKDARLPGFACLTRDGALFAVTIRADKLVGFLASPLVQDANQIQADRRIPPGSYRAVLYRYLATYAIQVPRTGSTDPRAVAVASSWSVTAVTART